MTTLLSNPPRTEPARHGVGWRSLHLWTDRSRAELDQLLTGVIAPLADDLQAAGTIRRWFFIRYSEGGQHIRLRLDGAAEHVAAHLAGRLGAIDCLRVTVSEYEPEIDRYGGADHLGVSETIFCAGTELVIAALARIPSEAHRISAAIDFVLATARGLDLDDVTAIAWLRSNAYSWRWHRDEVETDQAAALHNSALLAAADRAPAIVARWHGQPRATPAAWESLVRTATAELAGLPRARLLSIWSSQQHMLLNRLGIAPTEERWIEWLVAASLESPDGTTDFFATDARASDRAYLAASRFVAPCMADQAPRETPAPEQLFDWTPTLRAGQALAAPAPLPAGLSDALRSRRSGRGPYRTLGSPELSSLLWNATRPSGANGLGGHGFPSAGGQFPTRLRIAVRDVDGVAPGLYDVDPAARRLRRVGQAPPVPDLRATSMWFDESAPPEGRIEVADVPVVLGLYLDLGGIRARYGLRALRFALLEAGHLAQNLALIAASLGLQLCTLGGFYDDLAHEVFLLDGVDRTLAYLIPVGATA